MLCFETAASAWIALAVTGRLVDRVLLGVQVAGLVIAALTLVGVLHLLFLAQLVTSAAFGALLVRGDSRWSSRGGRRPRARTVMVLGPLRGLAAPQDRSTDARMGTDIQLLQGIPGTTDAVGSPIVYNEIASNKRRSVLFIILFFVIWILIGAVCGLVFTAVYARAATNGGYASAQPANYGAVRSTSAWRCRPARHRRDRRTR